MKNIGLVILAIVCLALGIVLVGSKKKAAEDLEVTQKQVVVLSNNWTQASASLEDQRRVNSGLEQDLTAARKAHEQTLAEAGTLSNNLSQASANLAKTEADLKTAKEEAAKVVAEKDARITDLEVQNAALDKRAQELTASITTLNGQIADTQKRLAVAEGDKSFLQNELKRLMTEKSDLERQFNDLDVLRAQVAKIKTEQNIARRMEWARQGIVPGSDQKGAQKLMQGVSAPQPKPAKGSYDLNVEIKSDGSVRVIPPLTNAPAAK